MSATLMIGHDKVTLSGGRWSSRDGRWVELLSAMTPRGISPSMGDPERWLAEQAARWLVEHGVTAAVVEVTVGRETVGEVY